MQQQVRRARFLQGRVKGCDQPVRQLANEAHRIAEQQLPAIAQVAGAGARIQRGKQFIVGNHGGSRQGVHEGGFARIGVAHEAGRDLAMPRAHLALVAANGAINTPLQILDALSHQPPVRLDLSLAGAAHADTALHALQVCPHALQPGKGVLELRQFHLIACLGRACAAGEDIQDQFRAVDYLAVRGQFEVLHLSGRQVNIHDDDVGFFLTAQVGEFLDLAPAKEGAGIG